MSRPADTLTQREKVVIGYLMAGCCNRDAARAMSITEQSIKNYVSSIYDKLGISSRLELVLYVVDRLPDLRQGNSREARA